jgi:hypothetical protein
VLFQANQWILTDTHVCHTRCVPKDVQERHVWPNVFFCRGRLISVVSLSRCRVKWNTQLYCHYKQTEQRDKETQRLQRVRIDGHDVRDLDSTWLHEYSTYSDEYSDQYSDEYSSQCVQ